MKDDKILKEVTPVELKQLLAENDIRLVDVREVWEKEKADIGGELITLSKVAHSLDKFDDSKQTIIYCRSGVRSANAIRFIEAELGLTNLYNLKGGILAWADQVDSRVEKY
jgi:adenylyltransferase/sulfurtransferase